MQLGDRRGAAGAARAADADDARRRGARRRPARRRPGGRRDAARQGRRARHAGHGRDRRLRGGDRRDRPVRRGHLGLRAATSRCGSRTATIDERARRPGARLLRAAARGRRRHRDPGLHALSARAPDHPADARPRDGDPDLRRAARAPGRARARHARARQPAARRGRVRLPLHRRAGAVPRAGHPLPAAAARRRRSRCGSARRRRGRWRHERAARAQRRPGAGRAAAGHHPARLRPDGDRLGADLLRRDARDLHGVGAGVRAALDGRQGPRLGHRRVRDAARVDGRAQAARRHQGPARTGARWRSSG